MTTHPDDRTLQLFLDGEISPRERWAIHGHLRECPECERRHDEMLQLVERVSALPPSIEPDVDLWPQIAARIAGTKPDSVQAHNAVPRRRSHGARFLALGWIAALAAALLLGIGLARMQQTPSSPRTAEVMPSAVPVGMLAGYEAESFDAAVGELQMILDQMRDQLQPATVAVLEANLAIIDGAIDDSRAALAADPANDHLHRHLAANLQTKLQLLRMVTTSVTAQS